MKFKKRQLVEADMGYVVSTQQLLGEKRVVAASESTGPAVVFDGDNLAPKIISTEPGGCMGFAPVPGRDDALFMITRFYPIFKSENAGIAMISATNRLEEAWSLHHLVDLPFVHRISSVSTESGNYLIGATVCESKDFQDDWSRPGKVLAFELNANNEIAAEPMVLLDSIHRNHGMSRGLFRGVDSLLISGDEGVFALSLPGAVGANGLAVPPWTVTTVLDQPVSELELFDLDGDGIDEIAVIEPFHGNVMSVYKDDGDSWVRVYTDEIAFGHGLSAGLLDGERVVVLGNRAGSKDLVCYRTTVAQPFGMAKTVIDEGSGTAGTTILNRASGDAVVTSNAEFSEYAIYYAEA